MREEKVGKERKEIAALLKKLDELKRNIQVLTGNSKTLFLEYPEKQGKLEGFESQFVSTYNNLLNSIPWMENDQRNVLARDFQDFAKQLQDKIKARKDNVQYLFGNLFRQVKDAVGRIPRMPSPESLPELAKAKSIKYEEVTDFIDHVKSLIANYDKMTDYGKRRDIFSDIIDRDNLDEFNSDVGILKRFLRLVKGIH